MRKTGLFIDWKNGSKNDNAIEELKKNRIAWEYNHFGELTVDFYGTGIFEKIDFEHAEGDKYEIVVKAVKGLERRNASHAKFK